MTTSQKKGSALVTFSGGQDSTTLLFWSKNRFDYVETISFFYGQNHSVELEQAEKICKDLNIKQTVIDISFLGQIVDSALTSNGNVNNPHSRLKHLPASFVPNRNMLFLTLANSYAQKVGIDNLVTGVCQTDSSGYSDCRNSFITSLQDTLGYSNYGYKVNPNFVHYLLSIGNTNYITQNDHPIIRIEESVLELKQIADFFGIQDNIETFNTNSEGILSVEGLEDCSYIYNFVKDREDFYQLKNKEDFRSWEALFKDGMKYINPHKVTKNDSFGSLVKIHTPLMYINKAETFKLAEEEGGLEVVLKDSFTCYNGDHKTINNYGMGCNICPSCVLRKNGYEEFIETYKK